jgi:hypothetical protein
MSRRGAFTVCRLGALVVAAAVLAASLLSGLRERRVSFI